MSAVRPASATMPAKACAWRRHDVHLHAPAYDASSGRAPDTPSNSTKPFGSSLGQGFRRFARWHATQNINEFDNQIDRSFSAWSYRINCCRQTSRRHLDFLGNSFGAEYQGDLRLARRFAGLRHRDTARNRGYLLDQSAADIRAHGPRARTQDTIRYSRCGSCRSATG